MANMDGNGVMDAVDPVRLVSGDGFGSAAAAADDADADKLGIDEPIFAVRVARVEESSVGGFADDSAPICDGFGCGDCC